MFQRLIRVILSAETSRFQSGMSRATATLGSFLGSVGRTVSGAVGFFNNLVNSIAHLPQAFDNITGAVENLFGQALLRERQQGIFASLTGSAEQAGDMMAYLRDESLKYGTELPGLAQSAQQVAVALRSQFGEVDPQKFQQLTRQVERFMALRPDVPVQLWGRAISGFLAGDVSTLTRALDINIRDIQGLSAEAKAFLSQGQDVQDQQLGSVTRLAGETAAVSGDSLAVLEELSNRIGATDDLLDAYANSTQGKLDQLKARWQDFVARVGEEFLPLLIKALDKLLKWIDTHQEEITAFIKGLGDFAATGWVQFTNALGQVEWDKVAQAVNALVELVTSPPPQWLTDVGTFIGGNGTTAGGGAQQAGSALGSKVRDFFTNNNENRAAAFAGQGGGGLFPQLAETISNAIKEAMPEIRVGIDPHNGNITGFVERTSQKNVTQGINEFVNTQHRIQRGNTSAGGGPK